MARPVLVAVCALALFMVGAPAAAEDDPRGSRQSYDYELERALLAAAGPPVREPAVEVGLAANDLEHLDELIDLGIEPDVFDVYAAWATVPDFDADLASELAERGITLKVTWEPWEPIPPGTIDVDQPDYALAAIAGGAHDEYITRWAEGIAAFGETVILRPMHEMNGGWYPWGWNVNGNERGDFVAAWTHIHTLFDEAGADNVVWEWAPNEPSPGSAPLDAVFPGEDRIDRAGVSAYNWGAGTVGAWSYRWKEFAEAVDPALAAVREVTGKPVGVSETGTPAVGGDKAAWLREMFDHTLEEDVAFLTYFNIETQRDWRLEGDPDWVDAFVEGLEATR
jgi:mannan endo-1,4-beta-mannosidase